MKKILFSFLTIGAVLALVGGATYAVFTDVETSTGNTFTAGTIDIAVNDSNPWTESNQFALTDMKPSYTDYIDFTINNVGTNPADVWKTLATVVTTDNVQSEPECAAEIGNWNGTACSGQSNKKDNIDAVIGYDLSVELYDQPNGTGNKVWYQRLYNDDVMISAIKDTKMYLGMIPEDYSMKVHQSYHMATGAGNEYQGDQMTFNIVLDAEQLLGGVRGAKLVLEDKTGDPDWDIIQSNGKDGLLNYTVMSPKFDFSFTGNGLVDGTTYALVIGDDPWVAGKLLGTGVAGGGVVNIADDDVELNQSYSSAKVWLVPSSSWNGARVNVWTPTSFLFETGLIEYRDTDL